MKRPSLVDSEKQVDFSMLLPFKLHFATAELSARHRKQIDRERESELTVVGSAVVFS